MVGVKAICLLGWVLVIISPVLPSANLWADRPLWPPAVALQARNLRDRADMKGLTQLIIAIKNEASPSANPATLALLEDWLCEAAYAHKEEKLVHQAADAGVRDAEEALVSNPDAAWGHWLLGDLLGKKIPGTFLGGLRYGPRSVRELETAMKLDPSSANAFISRAIAYYMTPRLFGGDKQKAIALMKKAAHLDPAPDSLDTVHIWLALAYDAENNQVEAKRQITLAQRLNPDRLFGQQVYDRIMNHD
jgi:tetratricopeptide (TPR) repeat protein